MHSSLRSLFWILSLFFLVFFNFPSFLIFIYSNASSVYFLFFNLFSLTFPFFSPKLSLSFLFNFPFLFSSTFYFFSPQLSLSFLLNATFLFFFSCTFRFLSPPLSSLVVRTDHLLSRSSFAGNRGAMFDNCDWLIDTRKLEMFSKLRYCASPPLHGVTVSDLFI